MAFIELEFVCTPSPTCRPIWTASYVRSSEGEFSIAKTGILRIRCALKTKMRTEQNAKEFQSTGLRHGRAHWQFVMAANHGLFLPTAAKRFNQMDAGTDVQVYRLHECQLLASLDRRRRQEARTPQPRFLEGTHASFPSLLCSYPDGIRLMIATTL